MTTQYLAIAQNEPLQFVKIRCKVKRQALYETMRNRLRLEYDSESRTFELPGDLIQTDDLLDDQDLLARFCFSGNDEGFFLVYSLRRASLLIGSLFEIFSRKQIKPFEVQWKNTVFAEGETQAVEIYQKSIDPFAGKELVMVDPDAQFRAFMDEYSSRMEQSEAVEATLEAMKRQEREPYPEWECRPLATGPGGNLNGMAVFFMIRSFACLKRYLGETDFSHSDFIDQQT